jgi:hypothetical protein
MRTNIERSSVVLILFAVIFTMSGCMIRHGDFTVSSNKLIRLSEFELSNLTRNEGVVGRDVQHMFCFIPTPNIPTIEGAMDAVLERGNGDVVIDASIKWYSWYIPLIYGQTGWVVKGDVVKTRHN